MIQRLIKLPKKHRLDLQLIKGRKTSTEKPFFSKLGDVRRIRSGNKFSRVFRYLFEHKSVKKLFGASLALIILISPLVPSKTEVAFASEESVVTKSPLVLTTDRKIQYPVENIKISQGYHYYHQGIDLDGKTGDTIYPIMPGRVKLINYSRLGYGNAVLISHEGGIESFYAHLSKIEVKEEQEVGFKTKIGEIGSTGQASGDHLHLEVRNQGFPIDPLSVLP